MKLSNALKSASKKVWKELRPAPLRLGSKIHPPREEALTSMMLRKLLESNCEEVKHVWMYDTVTENVYGFDFELWIGSENDNWIQFIVQAKKLNGNATNSGYDIDQGQFATILNFQRLNINAVPLYAFYNHVSNPNLEQYHKSPNTFKPTNLGITLIKPEVLLLPHRRNFNNIHTSPGGHEHFRLRRSDLKEREIRDLFNWCDAAFPFHELAYLDIDAINEFYQRALLAAPIIAYYYYYFYFMNEGKNPVQKITSYKKIIKGFDDRKSKYGKVFNPGAMVIIQKKTTRHYE